MKLLSRVRLFATPWTVAYQVPPSMGFSRQEYWSGLPFPSPGDLPDLGSEPGSPALQAPQRRWSQSILKEINPEYFTRRTGAEAEAPILWSPDMKNLLIGKDPGAGTDWRQEKGTTEDEMVGWHHWLDGHEFEQTGSCWWTGKPGVLQSEGLQRAGHNWVTRLNW